MQDLTDEGEELEQLVETVSQVRPSVSKVFVPHRALRDREKTLSRLAFSSISSRGVSRFTGISLITPTEREAGRRCTI
jgi:hypothetical protein